MTYKELFDLVPSMFFASLTFGFFLVFNPGRPMPSQPPTRQPEPREDRPVQSALEPDRRHLRAMRLDAAWQPGN